MINYSDLKPFANSLIETSSRLEKEAILRTATEKQKKFLYFLLNPYIVTGLSTQKLAKRTTQAEILTDFEEMFNYLVLNNTGRDVDAETINQFADRCEDREFILSIARKDLRLGIQSSTVNKIFPGFIPTFEVMLAENYYDHKGKVEGKEFILTQKLDGNRMVAIHKEDGSVEFFTRSGQPYGECPEIEEEIKQLPAGFVYDGEVIKKEEGEDTEELFRATTSIVRKDGAKIGVVFHIFDALPLAEFQAGSSKLGTSERKQWLREMLILKPFKWLREVPILYQGHSIEQIEEVLTTITGAGKEGIMINLSNAPYECKRTTVLLKVKKFRVADARVLSVYEGTGENTGKLGGVTIEFEYSGRPAFCDCGSGFSKAEREQFWADPSQLVGKIVEIQYFEISKDSKGEPSMRFPTWKARIRDDKNEISMY